MNNLNLMEEAAFSKMWSAVSGMESQVSITANMFTLADRDGESYYKPRPAWVMVAIFFTNHYRVCGTGDGLIAWQDIARLMKTGGQSATLLPDYSQLIAMLDRDNSGELSNAELWAPLNQLIVEAYQSGRPTRTAMTLIG